MQELVFFIIKVFFLILAISVISIVGAVVLKNFKQSKADQLLIDKEKHSQN